MKIRDPMKVIEIIRAEIFEETGCNASAGLGHSELIARLATRKAKPNGQYYVGKHEINPFIKEIPLSSIPGIGYSLMERLQEQFGDVKICKDLYSIQLSRLQNLLGEKLGKKV
jgi:DNA repair protein REV1